MPRPSGREQLTRLRHRVAIALRWRPEWPYILVVVGAWGAQLAGLGPGGHRATHGHQPSAHEHSALAVTSALSGPAGHGAGVIGQSGWNVVLADLPAAVLAWTVMSVAMMLPVALPATRHVALNSIRRRRNRAMALFVAAYVAVWVPFALVVLVGVRLVTEVVDSRSLLMIMLAVAACWQVSGFKRRSLARCRRTVPLPPVGRRADAACVRFGFLHGRRCVVSCWPLMVLMAVVEQGALVWMVALTALVCAEELTRAGRRLPGPSAAALTLTATVLAVLG